MEGKHEIQRLRFWNGNPTMHLLEGDEDLNAMLLEQCEPGTPLHHLPEPQQDVVIACLLRRLATMTAHWASETTTDAARWPDKEPVQEDLHPFEQLPRTSPEEVLATDLHAGNVLQAQREPWLVIDPKSFGRPGRP